MISRITSLAVIAAVLAMATEASAFEVKHSDAGELVSWRRPNVSFVVDPSVSQVSGAEDAAVAAARAWAGQDGAPALAVATSTTALTPGFDGKNAIFYVPGGYAPAGIALAITVLTFDDTSGEVLDADIVINGKYQFAKSGLEAPESVSGSASAKATYDIGRVLAHEMGHALGLSDEPGQDSALMYPFITRAKALSAAPGNDDLAGIAMLYGPAAQAALAEQSANDNAKSGCGGAVVASKDARDVPLSGVCAAGLAMLALAMARRGGRGRRGAAACTAGAALALLVLPGSASARAATSADTFAAPSESESEPETETDAVVNDLTTSAENGLFRTDLQLVSKRCTATCRASHVIVWGGTMGGIRQVVGGTQVPAVGERVASRRMANRAGGN